MMGGCAILLFSKRRMLKRIHELFMCEIKASISGFASAKGCVAMRFKIDETTFAFINCHLQAGEGNVIKRVAML